MTDLTTLTTLANLAEIFGALTIVGGTLFAIVQNSRSPTQAPRNQVS